ncbi:MAG: hypothetical protein AB1700_14670, partial [Bacillota bacterium]
LDSCRTELGKLGANTAAVTSIAIDDWLRNGIDEPTLRTAMGNAAKTSRWFKNLNDGERLARLVVEALPAIAHTPLGTNLLALEQWVYAK